MLFTVAKHAVYEAETASLLSAIHLQRMHVSPDSPSQLAVFRRHEPVSVRLHVVVDERCADGVLHLHDVVADFRGALRLRHEVVALQVLSRQRAARLAVGIEQLCQHLVLAAFKSFLPTLYSFPVLWCQFVVIHSVPPFSAVSFSFISLLLSLRTVHAAQAAESSDATGAASMTSAPMMTHAVTALMRTTVRLVTSNSAILE